MLGNREDARDAGQEVFLKFYRHMRRFNPERSIAPWLYRVTVNVCRDIGRRRARIKRELESHWAALAPGPGASGTEIEQQVILSERWQLLQRAVATLSTKERAAVILRDIEQLETRDVARILGITEVTVRSHLSRARIRLKYCLERMLGRTS
jgi:RNA polymerase sigma-70 factor, ECF subfamily